jgi:hypothetical protein
MRDGSGRLERLWRWQCYYISTYIKVLFRRPLIYGIGTLQLPTYLGRVWFDNYVLMRVSFSVIGCVKVTEQPIAP